MRVMHVITGLAAGGAENQLRLLLRHTRHDATVVTLTNPGAVAAAIREEGTPVVHLGMRGNRDVSAVGRLRALMRADATDLVHVHLYRSCIYGRVAARLAGVRRVVTTEHSLGEGYIEGRPTTPANRALYLATERLSDVTIAVSDAARRRLVEWGVPAHKVVVVPNGIDFEDVRFDPVARRAVRQEFGVPDDAFVVGALGRLDPIKRYDVLLGAVAPLLGPGVRLLIVGEGPARAQLTAQAAEAGVLEHVTFAGERMDVGRVLSAMDVLGAPSASETFGMGVIEALGSGLAVLHDECPAVDELPDRGAPLARRVPADLVLLREEITQVMGTHRGERLPHPAAMRSFSIEACSQAVEQRYTSLPAAGSSPR